MSVQLVEESEVVVVGRGVSMSVQLVEESEVVVVGQMVAQ